MATDNQFTEIWGDAYALYKDRTGRDLLQDPALSRLQTTADLLAQIETQNTKFKDFRDKKKKLWSVLKATMYSVEVIGRIAKSGVQGTAFGPASAIFVATEYLVSSARGVSEAYGSITELLERLADFSDRIEEYTKHEIDEKLRKRVTLILATLLQILAESERIMASGRLKEFGRVLFLGKDERLDDALNKLATLVTSEQSFVAAKTFSTAVSIEKELGTVSSLQIETKKEKLAENNSKLLNAALYSEAYVKVSEIHAHITLERQEGSGEWLKNEKLYSAWLKGEISTLFILGGPGSGKSFLAGSAINHLFARNTSQRGNLRISTGYFYVHEDDQTLRSLNTILKTVAFQLQERNPVYANHLIKVCTNPQKTVTATETWKSLFLDFFSAPQSQYGENSAFIVLDGVDEAPRKERETLFKLLRDLEYSREKSSPRIRVLVLGRPDLRDDTVFIWDKPIIYIEVSARKTKQDIVNYIKSSVGRVRALNQTREPLEKRKQLRKDIIKKLSDGANGMFLWVNLMFDQIYDMSRPSDVVEALETAPRSLSKMIHHAFRRLAADFRGFQKEDFNEILSWVTSAQRPLLLDELDSILRLRPPLGEGVPDLEKRLRDQFASFFILKRKDGLTTETLLERAALAKSSEFIHSDSDTEISGNGSASDLEEGDNSDGDHIALGDASSSGGDLPIEKPDPYDSPFSSTTVTFSHASIRDYLIRESNPSKRQFPSDLGIGVNKSDAEKHITLTCLQVLTEEVKLPHREHSDSDSDCSESSSSDGASSDDQKNDTGTIQSDEYVYDLEDYSADHFIDHLKSTDRVTLTIEEQLTITRCLLKLHTDRDSIHNWIDGITSLEDFATAWIGSGKNGEWVRGWFVSQMTNDQHYNEKEKDEMRKLSESDRDLLKQFATECATRWLTQHKDDYTLGYVAFLDEFVPQTGSAAIPDSSMAPTGAPKTVSSKSTTDISEARLRQIANYPDIEQNTFWHSNLGESMRREDHLEASVRHLEMAIKLDNKNWVAMGRLSSTYEDREQWELAIKWSHKALETSPKAGHKSKKSAFWQTISLCCLEIFDYAQAKDAAKEACLLVPEDGDALATYILALDAAMDHEELLTYIESLEKKLADDDDENLLTIALLANDTLHEVLGHAARKVGKLDFVIRACVTAGEAALRDDDLEEYSLQQLALGQLLYTQNQSEKKAIECWVSVMENKEAYSDIIGEASDHISQIYYREATTAEKKGRNSGSWISKLEKLAKYNPITHDIQACGAALLLGLWLRQHGKLAEARKRCYPSVIDALDLLANPDSDDGGKYGWTTLASALLKAGDRENAEAALAVEMKTLGTLLIQPKHRREGLAEDNQSEGEFDTNNPPVDDVLASLKSIDITAEDMQPGTPGLEDLTTEGEPGNSQLAKVEARPLRPSLRPSVSTFVDNFPDAPGLPGNTSWCCDGLCRRKVSSWKELYICKICLRCICFCEKCIGLVKNQELPFKICSSDHVFYKAYPAAEGMGITDDGKMGLGVGKEPEELDSWLSKVRKQWSEVKSL